jgi:hypothetical protein
MIAQRNRHCAPNVYDGDRLPLTCPGERACERATRTERAGAAARERACGGVRGATPLGKNKITGNHRGES